MSCMFCGNVDFSIGTQARCCFSSSFFFDDDEDDDDDEFSSSSRSFEEYLEEFSVERLQL
jgi:hypothetical protein